MAVALVLAVGVLAGTASATDATTQAVLDMADEAYGPDTLVCTVDGEPVTWPTYFYLLSEELQTLAYYTGGLPEN
ncbi:MAG: hypothetical protein J6X69_05270, partial [Bacteroidales bacterium]|nr:hypothetical protein [Bacteroidales bacterium]